MTFLWKNSCKIYKLPNIVSNQFYRATPTSITLPTTAQPLSTLPLSTIPSYPLQKANYFQVNFWTKKDWLESGECKKAESGTRGKGRLSKGINVRMRYIETAEGLVVDGFKASKMRDLSGFLLLSFVWHLRSGDSARSRPDSTTVVKWAFGFLNCCFANWIGKRIRLRRKSTPGGMVSG